MAAMKSAAPAESRKSMISFLPTHAYAKCEMQNLPSARARCQNLPTVAVHAVVTIRK